MTLYYSHFYIWLIQAQENHIADANRDLDHFIRSTPDLRQRDWESRIGQFLLGKIGESDLLAAAASPVIAPFGIRRGGVRHSATVQSLASGKEAAFCRYRVGKTEKARRSLDVDIHSFKTAPDRIQFMPKASPPSVSQELLPPFPMGFCPCPALKRIKITPILAHPKVRRKQRVEKIFVKKQAIGSSGDRPLNLGSEAKQRFNAREHVHPHAQIDDHQVGGRWRDRLSDGVLS